MLCGEGAIAMVPLESGQDVLALNLAQRAHVFRCDHKRLVIADLVGRPASLGRVLAATTLPNRWLDRS